MFIVDNIEQGSKEWLDGKLGRISASLVENIMKKGRGGAPSKMSESYMMDLISETLTGESKPFFENAAMLWGTEKEPLARDLYSAKNDFVAVREVAYVEHNKYILISPDGLVGHDGLLEIKCPNTDTQLKRALSGIYHSDYKAQIQMQLWVTERKWCDFVSFDPRLDCGASYLQERVFRDEEYISEMKTKVYAFVEEMNVRIEKILMIG